MKRGAAVLAERHKLPVVPIRVSGTSEVMPPGRFWPKRLHGKIMSKRHKVEVCFGEPIKPSKDSAAVIDRVQNFFDANGDGDGRFTRIREKVADRY